MGVLDDGTVLGVPEKAAPDMVKNFITVVSNPALFFPTVYLVPEIIRFDEKRTIIHVHIPSSAEVHSYKRVIYDRVNDSDVKATATGAIAQMYIRKQICGWIYCLKFALWHKITLEGSICGQH